MLAHRLRRQANIEPTLGQRRVFAVIYLHTAVAINLEYSHITINFMQFLHLNISFIHIYIIYLVIYRPLGYDRVCLALAYPRGRYARAK